MMKKLLLVATFLAVGGGTVGVSAGNPAAFKGSDTLFDFTKAIITACPGTQVGTPVLAYQGTGSGNGEKAMLAGSQTIAPMSRFLNKNACSGAVNSPTTSQGLVVGLDGLSIVGSKSTFTSTACNGDTNTTCDPTFETGTGAAYSTTVAVGTCDATGACPAGQVCAGGAGGTCNYTFVDWRDVLRVLLAGFDHTNNGTAASNLAARDCASTVRVSLANGYGKVFENNCTAPAGDTTGGVCTIIRHILRRDDFSGTTDTVVGLLNLPSVVTPETTVTVFNDQTTLVCSVVPDGGTAACPPGALLGDTCNATGKCQFVGNSITQHTGSNPFCNSVRPAFALPQSATALQPTCLNGGDATWDPTSKNTGLICSVGVTTAGGAGACAVAGATCNTTGVCVACPKESSVYRSTMQDNDPIRRTCAGTGLTGIGTFAEDNCSHSGDLGLVLVMNDVPETGDVGTTSDPLRYNATPCAAGKFTSAQPPDAYDAVTQQKTICSRGLLCPNGDFCTNTAACIVPADATGNPQCLASKLRAPANCLNQSLAVPLMNPRLCGIAEGRAFNQHLYHLVGGAASYQNNGFTTPLNTTGAFFRLHTNHSMNPASTAAAPITCQFADMTDQIGCLVNASPCSIGYAGRGATDHNLNTDAIKINKQSPSTLCITGNGTTVAGFTYPFSRKLYLSTVPGFSALTANEQALAGCETNLAQTVPPMPGTPPDDAGNPGTVYAAGLVTTNIAGVGFIALPSYVNGGNPYCEDFNENMLCSPSPTAPKFATNSASCPTTVPANFSAFPTSGMSTCGDGILDPFEDCDCGTDQIGTGGVSPASNVTFCNGTNNNSPPATQVCTNTCRFLH